MRAQGISGWITRLAMTGLALGCLLAAGCAPSKQVVRVESSGHPAPEGARFLVVPGVMDTKPGDLKFQNVARQLSELLVRKGYTQVASYDQADLVVYLAYAIKGSVRPGQAPGGGFLQPGLAPTPAPTAMGLHVNLEGEKAAYGPTQQLPTAGFMGGGLFGGGHGRMGPEVRYDLSFLIEAVDLARYKKNDPDHIVWQIRAASAGLPDDVTKAMPYIVAAVSDYIGKSAFLSLEIDDKMHVTIQKGPRGPHGPGGPNDNPRP